MEMLESSLAWLQPLKFQHYDQNITGHMRFGRSSRSANCASQTCCPRAFSSPCQWEVYCLFASFACTIPINSTTTVTPKILPIPTDL